MASLLKYLNTLQVRASPKLLVSHVPFYSTQMWKF